MTRRGWLLFAALSVIWGLPYLFIKVAVADMTPMFVVAGRLTLAAVLLVPLVTVRGWWPELAGHWRWLAVLAVIEMMIPFGLLAWAETLVTSSLAGLMIASVPTIAALAAAVLRLSDRLDARRIFGLVIGICGVAVLTGLDVGAENWLAILALLGVAVGYAIGPIIINTKLSGPPGTAVMTAAVVIAAVAYSPWLVRDWPDSSSPASPAAWWSVAGLGAICTALAFLVMYALITEAGPTRMTVITYLNPVVAVTLGVVVLSEPITTGMLIGFPLIALGSVFATARSAPAPERRDSSAEVEPSALQ